LSFADPLPVTISGQLLDTSRSGFRAAHQCPSLHTGMEVSFEHASASGNARVAWTRIAGNAVETGFVIYGQRDVEHPTQHLRRRRMEGRSARTGSET